MECVKETGYQPNYFAQNIRKQSNRLVSIITEDLTVFGTNPVVEAIMAYCDDHNYRTILMNLRLYKKWKNTWYDENEKMKEVLKPIIQEALSIRVNGIIYVAGHCRLIDYFPPGFPIPAVITYGMSKDNRYPSIVIDDEKGGYDTTRYLTAKGHRKIGVIAGAVDNLHTKFRLLGYQKALYEEGILYNPSLVYYGDWVRQSGYFGAKRLVEEGVTAIFCMNDSMAVGAYDYLYERTRVVGQDMSVVGYDNMELSDCLRPRLTTNGIQLAEIGRKSAEIMIQTLEGAEEIKNGAKTIKVPCKMVERESVISLACTR
jgi:LacI family transcriptional regulator